MPAQELTQPNPPPDPSTLSDVILDQAVKLDYANFLSKDDLESIQTFRRAANYIAAGASVISVIILSLLTLEYSYDISQGQRPCRP